MLYFQSASSISHQDSFRNKGFSKSMELFDEGSELIIPSYKEIIEPQKLRRMSNIIRMSASCAFDCLSSANVQEAEGIVVGTGLGCLFDTEKFLFNMNTLEGLIPPTSFISSTHNNIAGQISLLLQNNHYNITHTQNTLSFEHALLDTELLLEESSNNILVGAADEVIDFLKELNISTQLSSGSSFFLASNEKTEQTLATLINLKLDGLCEDIFKSIDNFLEDSNTAKDEIDLVLYTSLDPNTAENIEAAFESSICKNYSNYCGLHASTSAFALHWAIDAINDNKDIGRVLICNNLQKQNLGLTLISA